MSLLFFALVILIAAIGGGLMSVMFTKLLFRPYSPKDIFGFRLHGIVPAILPGLASYASAQLKDNFLSEETLGQKLTDPVLLAKLKPEIETHVDEFLKVKLKEAFPLLSNFMGEKTLAKFKEAFLTEVETILPALLKSYSGQLLVQWKPDLLLEEKLNSIDLGAIEAMAQQKFARRLRSVYLLGVLAGAAIGVLQVLVLLLAQTYFD
ncbi:MAG: hypothetical protein EOO10_24105 [Chitinophagaceae bacterium]|nr:MAG: hypothetical protein EOO10_24105 [Chitinophagaceae bacterium]